MTREAGAGSAFWDDEGDLQPHHDITAMSGTGTWIVEASGRRLLDAGSGHSCVNLGYGNTDLIEAAAESYRRLAYCSPEHRSADHGPGGHAERAARRRLPHPLRGDWRRRE